ncbi:unnamed protein product [Protopolystoma xenopodis]|uniref:Uncharacterized protein n=1 Tax=Protopolystoma xenopodis TaxID=117903 RepID=A0A3S5FFK1_9PLAT|nr:unnamed protein product [Protopolystoma xenopodis]
MSNSQSSSGQQNHRSSQQKESSEKPLFRIDLIARQLASVWQSICALEAASSTRARTVHLNSGPERTSPSLSGRWSEVSSTCSTASSSSSGFRLQVSNGFHDVAVTSGARDCAVIGRLSPATVGHLEPPGSGLTSSIEMRSAGAEIRTLPIFKGKGNSIASSSENGSYRSNYDTSKHILLDSIISVNLLTAYGVT